MSDIERLRNIKIIVSDVDGTLVNRKGLIGPETKKLICELHKYDVLFSFATGRLHSAVIDLAKDLEIANPIISLDGSLIKDFPGGRTIFESFIKQKYVRKATKYAQDYLLNVALCHSDAIYYTETNSVIPSISSKFGARYEEVESYDEYLDGTLEIFYAGDSKESIEFVRNKFEFPYATGCDVSYFRSHSQKGIYYLEIRKSGSSKGKGLHRLLKYLKIKPENAAVMGDWYNDISMFDSKAIKVAVANSIPELLRKADHVTERSNNHEGVAEFLDMVLRAKSS
ncbi:MAG: HAD family hydrolase [Ignavibacteria bacterium]|jgi:Cof subfamily protein (haloacid dehalogenase superfamily)